MSPTRLPEADVNLNVDRVPKSGTNSRNIIAEPLGAVPREFCPIISTGPFSIAPKGQVALEKTDGVNVLKTR
jgi:hypothetical protein